MQEKIELKVSSWTIIKVILICLSFYLLFLIKDIIALFFVVLILTATLRPIVNRWETKIGRLPSVLTFLLIAVAIIALSIYIIIPPVVEQLKQLVIAFPDFVNHLTFLKPYSAQIKNGISSLSSNVGNITGSFVSITAGIFGGVISIITATVMTVYLLLDKKGIAEFIKTVIPDQNEAIIGLARKVSRKVGDWFRGQMLLCAIIGVIDFIGLVIIGVPYALTLALISGIFEIIPTIGPMLSGAIAILIVIGVSPLKALLVLILYIVVQQLENSFIVPKIMQKAVGLSPVVIILAFLIAAKLMGVMGAILAVPIAASLSVLIKEWPLIKSTLSKNA